MANKGETTYQQVRLSLMAAARELGLSRNKIRTALGGTPAGADGCYSIKEVVNALYTSSKSLKDETERQRSEWYRLRNEKFKGRLLDRDAVQRALDAVYSPISQIVKASNLHPRDKSDLMKQMADSIVVLQKVAEAQAREMGNSKTEAPEDE
jgi:hypothetical protein